MLRIAIAMIAALLPLAALAGGGWTLLDGGGITAALSDRWLQYDDGAGQFFAADGGTTYGPSLADQNSSGRWRVEGDQYCSVWPPSDLWACYDVARSADGEGIRFIAGDGSMSDGRYAAAP